MAGEASKAGEASEARGLNMYKRLFWILLFTVTVLKLIYIGWGPLDLSPDEAHYWDWSRQLAPSYYSKGPVVAYTIFLGTKLGELTGWQPSNPAFWVRFPAVIFSMFLGIIVWLLTKRLWLDDRLSWYTVLAFLAVPVFALGSILMTIDNPLVLFWALFVYLIALALSTKRSWPWYLAGLALGLGFLTKYTMIVLVPCLILYLLTSRQHRVWLAKKEFFFCLLIGALCSLPLIWWNEQHGWLGLRHLLGQAGGGALIADDFWSSVLEFVFVQAAVISPLIFIFVIWGFIIGLRTDNYIFKLLFWLGAPLLLFYLLLSFHKHCQPNWPVPAYFTGILLAAVIFLLRYPRGFQRAIALGLLMWLPVLLIPLSSDLCGFFPLRLNPYSRVEGWKRLGEEVGRIKQEFTKQGACFVFSDRYQLTGELAFYLPDQPRVYCTNTGRRMNQYDLWNPPPLGQNGIYVKHRDRDMDKETASLFQSWKKLPLVEVPRGKEFSVFLCYGFRGWRSSQERENEISY